MANLRMNLNKEQVISAIINNQNILKCLGYTDNSVDIFELEDFSIEESIEIAQKSVFRYRKIPSDKEKEQRTYISMEYGEIVYTQDSRGGRNKTNPYFKLPDINVFVISHSSLDINNVIGSRIDAIEEEICDIFHNEYVIDDFGKSFLIKSMPLYLPNDYVGRQITIRFIGKIKG